MTPRTRRRTYEFTLVLADIEGRHEDVEDALYGGGCDDALFGIDAGTPYLDFAREADSFADAVLSAVEEVEGVGVELRVVSYLLKSLHK
jgi:hypothetical protein